LATVLRESGTEGSGGGFNEDAVDVVAVGVVLLDPVSPTEALVAPPLVSHGFGGDGEDIFPRVARLAARSCECEGAGSW